MRLLIPPRSGLRLSPGCGEPSKILAGGWQLHLEAAAHQPELPAPKELKECPRCKRNSESSTRLRAGRSPGSFGCCPLLLAETSFDQGLASELDSAAFEGFEIDTKDEEVQAKLTHDDLRAWLGSQASVLERALETGGGADFVGILADAALASQAVANRQGLSLRLGPQYGQDFRRARDRALSMCLLDVAFVRHLWITLPPKAQCAYVRLNLARGCDLRATLREGRLFLRHATRLARQQRLFKDGRRAHLDNPQQSLAWGTEPLKHELRQPGWRVACLDQCCFDRRPPSVQLQKCASAV